MNEWGKIAKKDREKQNLRGGKRIFGAIKSVKTWQLAIILVIFVVLTATFLRLNNLGMMTLRDDLKKADETGEIAKVETASQNLQHFVANHMNTSTGKIPLQTLYTEAARAAIAKNKPPEIDSEIYAAAQQNCLPQLENYGYESWAACVADTVGINSATLEQKNVNPPDPDAFYVDFASARWSFDVAGILLFISVIFAIVIIFRVIFAIILRAILFARSRKMSRI